MDIIIREAKETNNLFQIEVYDADLAETSVVDGLYFESESFAEKYGKEQYKDDNTYGFVRVVMKNGKEAQTKGNVLYGDANHPGDIFICPKELEDMLLQLMSEEGMCPYKCKGHWFPKNYSFCMVKLADEFDEGCIPLELEWDD